MSEPTPDGCCCSPTVGAVEDADRDAIVTLAHLYAVGADRRDVAMFLSAFSPDAVLEVYRPGDELVPTSVYVGHTDLARIPPALARYDRTDHVVHDVQMDTSLGDDEPHHAMSGTVSCTAHHIGTDGGVTTDTVMTITYHDTYARVDGRLLIDRRQVRMSSIAVVPIAQPIAGDHT